MMMSLIFDSLRNLYRKGDLRGYSDYYQSLTDRDIIPEISLLSVHVFCTMGDWKEAEKNLRKLRDSGSPVYSAKARLIENEIDFLLCGYSIEKANRIIELCDNAQKDFPNDEFMCFADEVKHKIRSAMLTWGILNAEDKKEHIEIGKQLLERFFVIDKAHSFDFMATLVNDSYNYPCPDAVGACELVKRYRHWIDTPDSILDVIPVCLASITPLLRVQYPERSMLPKDRLPVELKEVLEFCSKAGYVAGKAFIESKYGSYLLELENMEGITWIASSIKEFIHFGYYKQADLLYKQAVACLENNSQMTLLYEFKQASKMDVGFSDFPYKKETELLKTLHKIYARGDYELAMKLSSEYLASSICENTRVGIICMMMNSGIKLGVSKRLLKLIDAEIERLYPLKKSVLLAQYYQFKALAEDTPRNRHWLMAIELYHATGYLEDELQCRLYSLCGDIQKIKDPSVNLLSDPVIVDNFQIIQSQLDSIVFLPNRNMLKGQYYQYYGLACLNHNIEEAYNCYKKAEECFMNAGSLRLYAQNMHCLGGTLITIARQSRDIRLYNEAIHILEKGIRILSDSELFDFVWRLNFLLFVCHSEILKYNLIAPDAQKRFAIKTENLLNETLESYALLFTKICPKENSEWIVASISLYRDARQLLEQGFNFYYILQKWEECILWIEKSYSRSLISILSNNMSLPSSMHPLIREENEIKEISGSRISIVKSREIQRQLDSLYREMLNIPKLRVYAQSKLKILPDYVTLQRKIANEENRLDSNQKLFFIYYFVVCDSIHLLAVSSVWERPFRTVIPLSANSLKKELEGFRNISEADEEFFVRSSVLIELLASYTMPNDIICFIPHGIIHNLPLHALLLEGEPLIVRNPVFYNSSMQSWDYIQFKKNMDGNEKNIFSKVNIIGNPTGDLHYADQEAQKLSEMFHTEVLTGNVSKEMFIEKLVSASLFHFTGHGYYREDNGFQSALRLSQGTVIRAKDIIDLKLEIELAVLSACETGKYKVYSGEEQLGLSSALLMAGARSVISSLWPVDDEATEIFFVHFYWYLKTGCNKITALQQAMIDVRNIKKQTNLWAAFILQGSAF